MCRTVRGELPGRNAAHDASMRPRYSSSSSWRPRRVHVGVRQVVEPQHSSPAGPPRHERSSSAFRARRRHRSRAALRERAAPRAWAARSRPCCGAAAAQRHAHHHPEPDHQQAGTERDLASRALRAGRSRSERAAERPQRPDRRQPAHRRAGVLERGEPQLHHRRMRHREREDRGPPAPTTASVASDPPSSRRGPSPSTIGRASSTSTPATISVGPSVAAGRRRRPTAHRPTPRRRSPAARPDRRRVGLERQPDVGGGEPHSQDLQHQDDPGGDEHHGGGEQARHRRSLRAHWRKIPSGCAPPLEIRIDRRLGVSSLRLEPRQHEPGPPVGRLLPGRPPRGIHRRLRPAEPLEHQRLCR